MLSAEPLRVGYVVKRFPRYSETFIVTELLAHEAAGWSLEVFALRPPNDSHFQSDLAHLRAPVRYLPSEGLRAADFWAACEQASVLIPDVWQRLADASGGDARDVFQALVLAYEIRAGGLEHLHAHFAGLPATVARLAARMTGITYSFTAHAKDIYLDTVDADGLRRNLQDAALTVTVSDFNREYLRARFGPAAARVQRIYNGLDLTKFHVRPLRAREPVIVAVGRLVEKKGFADLIEACAHLVASGRAFRCEIIGEGELEPQLRARIAALGISNEVRLHGARPTHDVVDAIGRAAVFAAPCVTGSDGNRDGLPTTVLEAMALGTPVATTDVTGLPEAVQHEVSGLVVPQHDPARLASAITRLFDDEPLRRRIVVEARRVIERRFDSRVNAAALRSAWCGVRRAEVGVA